MKNLKERRPKEGTVMLSCGGVLGLVHKTYKRKNSYRQCGFEVFELY